MSLESITSIVLYLTSFYFVSVVSLGIDDWGRCKISASVNDLNECLSKGVTKMIISLKPGSTELGIQPFEPFELSKMDLKSGGAGPVSLELILENIKLIHITDITDVYVDASRLADMSMKIKVTVPAMNVTGKYTMNGRLLAVPLKGNGDAQMFMTGVHIELRVKGKPSTKDGKSYWDIDFFQFTFMPTMARIYYSNLFNGDKQLGDGANKVLNENWELVFKEFQDPISKEFAKVALPIANKIGKLEPFDQMFPK